MILDKKKLKKVEKWLKKRDHTLVWGRSDQIIDQVVQIRRGSKELYSLLHECGHVVVYQQKEYEQEYHLIDLGVANKNVARTKVYRYQKMREEIEAWEAGFKLAQKWGWSVPRQDYFAEAAKWVNTYHRYLY